jgi:hypothetical protein
MSIKAKRFDKDSYQIVDGDKVVALALAMASGGWIITDLDGAVLDGKRRVNPLACAKRYAEMRSSQ